MYTACSIFITDVCVSEKKGEMESAMLRYAFDSCLFMSVLHYKFHSPFQFRIKESLEVCANRLLIDGEEKMKQ